MMQTTLDQLLGVASALYERQGYLVVHTHDETAQIGSIKPIHAEHNTETYTGLMAEITGASSEREHWYQQIMLSQAGVSPERCTAGDCKYFRVRVLD